MEQRDIIALLSLVVFGGVGGFGICFLFRPPATRRSKELDTALESAHLSIDGEVRASLERHMARRSLWGAVGGGVGYSIGFPAGTLLSDDRAAAAGMTALPALICLMFGMSLGMALSARRTAAPAPDRARVTTLQPHGLTDYLSRRDLAAEVTLGVIGLCVAAVGCRGLVGGSLEADPSTARLLLVLGLLVATTAITALAVQRRLLDSSMRAESEAQLVANDIVLATGLRDLVGAVGSTAALAGYAGMLWFGVAWWLIVLYLAAAVGLSLLVLDHKLRPGMVPVARRLAASRQPA